MPLLALQAAVSAGTGALLLSALHALASLSSLVAPALAQRLGCKWTLLLGYGHACLFFGLHLYPTPYTLVPAYLALGLWLGPLVSGRVTFLMTLASKLSYVATEEEDAEDVVESSGRRQTVVRRLARGLQTAQDFGLVFGNGITAFLLWYTQPGGCLGVLEPMHRGPVGTLPFWSAPEYLPKGLPFEPLKHFLQSAISSTEECNFQGRGNIFRF
jgi:hypothetical protein